MTKMECMSSLAEMRDNCEAAISNSDLEHKAETLNTALNLIYGRREKLTEAIHINLNEKVKFRLTERGKYIWYHQYDQLNEHYGRTVIQPSLPEIDDDGYSEEQIWKLVEIFGPYTSMASENYIDPLEIIFEPHKEKHKRRITVKEFYEYCKKRGAEDYTMVLEDENLAQAELQKEDICFYDEEKEVIIN